MNLRLLFVAVCATASAIGLAGADRFPDAPGKTELLNVCGTCHEPDLVFDHPQTAGEWSQTLENMAQAGAEATDAQWQLIEKYLNAQIAMIPVNSATAAELQATFDVAESVAQAIVRHRQANGKFASAEDLKKVAGLDAARVDARKDRLLY